MVAAISRPRRTGSGIVVKAPFTIALKIVNPGKVASSGHERCAFRAGPVTGHAPMAKRRQVDQLQAQQDAAADRCRSGNGIRDRNSSLNLPSILML